jgi:predicted dehydrogenase
MKKKLRVGIVGAGFMGRAHSNAYIDVAHFFDLPEIPVMQAACDTNESCLKPFADRFGWKSIETSFEKLVARDDIDLVDICTSNATHLPIAVSAAKAGKHILCEKPLARNAAEAQIMFEAARSAGVIHMVAHNYRRVPAIALAKQLIDQGKLGCIHHFNAVYYQDWLVDPQFPLVWRHDIKKAGSGAHGDMNAHIVDLAMHLVGEVEEVSGAQEIFVKERSYADGSGTGQVTADDATYFLARFRDGALGSFLSTRFATGQKNYLRLEIFGSNGAIKFNLERLNELEYYSRTDQPTEQGFRTILVTESTHPYMNAWWPSGHIIGWEHTFIHEVRDFLAAIGSNSPVHPDFYDGLRCQLVLDAVVESAEQRKWVSIPEK